MSGEAPMDDSGWTVFRRETTYPPLSPDEELELISRWREGDEQAERRLGEAHLALAAEIVERFAEGLSRYDAAIAGNTALFAAMREFVAAPPASGRLADFAAPRIEAAIRASLATQPPAGDPS